eukprot:g44261.t1
MAEEVEDEVHSVEAILGKRLGPTGSVEYLIKWEGFAEAEASWEDEGNIIDGLQDLLADFESREEQFKKRRRSSRLPTASTVPLKKQKKEAAGKEPKRKATPVPSRTIQMRPKVEPLRQIEEEEEEGGEKAGEETQKKKKEEEEEETDALTQTIETVSKTKSRKTATGARKRGATTPARARPSKKGKKNDKAEKEETDQKEVDTSVVAMDEEKASEAKANGSGSSAQEVSSDEMRAASTASSSSENTELVPSPPPAQSKAQSKRDRSAQAKQAKKARAASTRTQPAAAAAAVVSGQAKVVRVATPLPKEPAQAQEEEEALSMVAVVFLRLAAMLDIATLQAIAMLTLLSHLVDSFREDAMSQFTTQCTQNAFTAETCKRLEDFVFRTPSQLELAAVTTICMGLASCVAVWWAGQDPCLSRAQTYHCCCACLQLVILVFLVILGDARNTQEGMDVFALAYFSFLLQDVLLNNTFLGKDVLNTVGYVHAFLMLQFAGMLKFAELAPESRLKATYVDIGLYCVVARLLKELHFVTRSKGKGKPFSLFLEQVTWAAMVGWLCSRGAWLSQHSFAALQGSRDALCATIFLACSSVVLLIETFIDES